MDVDNLKEMAGKFFKGCGCLTVGFFILVMIVGIFADDDGRGPDEIDGEDYYSVTNETEFLAALGSNRT